MPQTLTHSPAQIIRQLLLDRGLGASSGDWQVFYAMEPNAPDNCLTVYDTTGTDDGRSMVTGELFGHDGFQVRIRAKDHATGWLKADAIQTDFAEGVDQQVVTVDSTRYLVHAITRIGNVLALGRQTPQSMRSIFTLNATVPLSQLA